MSTDPAVTAAAEAMDKDIEDYSTRKHDRPPSNERMAEVAVAAARPIIEAEHADCICHRVNAESRVNGEHAVWIEGVEYRPVAEVRERIAADIEFLRLGCRNGENERLDALDAAARIARGQS